MSVLTNETAKRHVCGIILLSQQTYQVKPGSYFHSSHRLAESIQKPHDTKKRTCMLHDRGSISKQQTI